jgi:amino acid adenylation domain-containing protein
MIKNIIEYLRESARKFPDKIAIKDENRELTFSELDSQARKVATLIIQKCGDIKNQPIAVYMDKSVECIVSFLGIAYSGNFYSPLDLKSPTERINRIIDVLNPVAVISKKEELDVQCKKISIDAMDDVCIDKNIDEKYKKILDTDPLYVLFTSGSTGQPKGVVISHKSVIDYTEWLHDKFGFDEENVFGNQAPFHFDNSILDIYSTIKNGATMVIIPEKLFVFPKLLLSYIEKEQINTIFWVPSALVGVANSGVLNDVALDNLKKILFCGEVMPNKQLNIWRRHIPNAMYANLYGPTEITDVCTYYIVDREFRDDEPLPIGYACENTEILVLNDKDELVGQEEIGELCVRGICLSMGYYGDYEKTDKVFVQNPLNNKYHEKIYRTGDLVKYNQYGELIYICRKDFQIKLQGHRIELGEIETAASALDDVEQNCAIFDDVNKKIILFCTIKNDLSEKSIYKSLQSKIPKYMLPSIIKILDEMPLNINGKIDRVKLKNLGVGKE